MTYQKQQWRSTLRTVRYGSVDLLYSVNDPSLDQRLKAKWLFGVDVQYQVLDTLLLAIGGHNILNTYPDFNDNQGSGPFYGEGDIFQYSDSSPFGFSGASYYFRINKQF